MSQVYVPDPAAVGQYLHDVAVEMVKRGWEVIVFTSNRGYDNPGIRYSSFEIIDGVEIRRLPLSSFGKKSILTRILSGLIFTILCCIKGLLVTKVSALLITTSPPLILMAALVISCIKRMPTYYWVMDLNPDQLIAMNLISETSVIAKLLYKLNCYAINNFHQVIMLDKFMAERIQAKCIQKRELEIIPLWPLETVNELIDHSANKFRASYCLEGKFVVMYSGNHAASNPINTILDAALKLQDYKNIMFIFIGGGVGKSEVNSFVARLKPANIISLPYQPLSDLKYSLSAADLHVVSMGERMVGSVHPCKVYGIMSVGRPILYLGPEHSHIAEILKEANIGIHVNHDDVEGVINAVITMANKSSENLKKMGIRARELVDNKYSREDQMKRFCDLIDNDFSEG